MTGAMSCEAKSTGWRRAPKMEFTSEANAGRTVNVLLGGNGEIEHLWRQPILMLQVSRYLQTSASEDSN